MAPSGAEVYFAWGCFERLDDQRLLSRHQQPAIFLREGGGRKLSLEPAVVGRLSGLSHLHRIEEGDALVRGCHQ